MNSEVLTNAGYLPISLDVDGKGIRWMDFGKYHPYEAFFRESISSYSSLYSKTHAGSAPKIVSSDLIGFQGVQPPLKGLKPTAFILHMSRCGSTLLAKCLTRSRQNLVISEAPLLGQALFELPPEKTTVTLRNLVLAMGRKRVPSHQRYFVKFQSAAVLKLPQLQEAFPRVPKLFLYRDPLEVYASLKKRPSAWLNEESQLKLLEGLGVAFHDFQAGVSALLKSVLETALNSPELALLNYRDLNSHNFSSIVRHLGESGGAVEPGEIETMGRQLGLYSKSDYSLKPFVPDGEQKRESLDPSEIEVISRELQPLYQTALASSRNLFPQKRPS